MIRVAMPSVAVEKLFWTDKVPPAEDEQDCMGEHDGLLWIR